VGNFYANFTVRSQEPEAVARALAGRNALVTPATNGCVVVFEETSDAFDLQATAEIAAHLSLTLKCAVLAVANYDDDVLCYQLFETGKQVDTYDSCPGYFDGSPSAKDGTSGGEGRLLCAAFGVSNPEVIDTILRAPEGDGGYTFAVDRHHDLFAALRLPDFGVGIGYRYLEQGELPEGLRAEELLRAPAQMSGVAGQRARSVLGLECWVKERVPGFLLIEAAEFFVARLGHGGSAIPRPILATNVVKVDFAGVGAGKGNSARPLMEESLVAPLHQFVHARAPFVQWQDPQQGLVAVRDVLTKMAAGLPSGASEPLSASQRKSLEEELRLLEGILTAAAQAGIQFLLVHEE
jgi:hypothetical protein